MTESCCNRLPLTRRHLDHLMIHSSTFGGCIKRSRPQDNLCPWHLQSSQPDQERKCDRKLRNINSHMTKQPYGILIIAGDFNQMHPRKKTTAHCPIHLQFATKNVSGLRPLTLIKLLSMNLIVSEVDSV